MSSIHIYWDESHFWGLLVTRALSAWGIPHRLVRGSEIADGALSGKLGEVPKLLIAPGGRAKGKADRLGPRGMEAVDRFVQDGGTYLGFCGGTGLALSGPNGLGLSPWTRRGYKNRLHHLLSGHMEAELNTASPLVPDTLSSALLPVWWPGRFAPVDDSVTVLARYGAPGPDFWVADLNLATLPEGTMTDWENLYGISLRPDFMQGLPCVTANDFGAGRVILSYAHLETPASRQANAWLLHILGEVLGEPLGDAPLPAWDVSARPAAWKDDVLPGRPHRPGDDHRDRLRPLSPVLAQPLAARLAARRIPGAGINSLYSLVCESLAVEPCDEALAFWKDHRDRFRVLMTLLVNGLTGYLLAERLSMTVFHSDPDAVSAEGLREQRRALFGLPTEPGGIHSDLVGMLEELYWRLSPTGNRNHS